MRAPLIHTQGLEKIYRLGESELHALAGVSVDIAEGEFVAVMGPSGSGKSTFMNVVGWLAQQENLISIRPREADDRRLTMTGGEQQPVVQVVALALQGLGGRAGGHRVGGGRGGVGGAAPVVRAPNA